MMQCTTDFIIAYTIFGADGIVLDLSVKITPAVLFMDCNYWSCFVHENERLLIGGLCPLQFSTIRNISQSENYSQYIKSLNVVWHMIRGYRLGSIKPAARDVAAIQQIIQFEVNGEETGIPGYIQKFIHHFLTERTQILLNFGDWKHHVIKYMPGWGYITHGYKKVAHLFTCDNAASEMINFSLFMKLFPNTKVFCVGDFDKPTAANPSINLSSGFTAKMMECLDYLDKSSPGLSHPRFEVIKPSASISEYIKNNKEMFESKGWKLKDDEFYSRQPFTMKEPQKMLLIEKMKD